MYQLYFMEVGPLPDKVVINNMAADISDEKRKRLLRYRHDIDRKLGIYADVLLRCLICRVTGAQYREIEFGTGTAGKPFMKGNPGCEFNISHTRNAVAAAVSDCPVGVDVERVGAYDAGVAHRYFSANELAYFESSAQDRDRRFFEIWTKKEAFVKYCGTGLSDDFGTIDVTGRCAEKFSTFLSDGYIISVCAGKKLHEKDFSRISESAFIDMWRKFAR